MTATIHSPHRILIADDEQAIRDEFLRVLCPAASSEHCDNELAELKAELFDRSPEEAADRFEVVQCRQGNEAIEAVMEARAGGRPFNMAFLDVRMPPGPNGIEAAAAIRKHDPDIYIVIVTGYSDIHPREIARKVPPTDKLFYLLKPLHGRELEQLAKALNTKWQVEQTLRRQQQELEQKVAERTASLSKANETLKKEIAERRRVEEALRKSTKSAQLLQKIAVAANQAPAVDEAMQACLDGDQNPMGTALVRQRHKKHERGDICGDRRPWPRSRHSPCLARRCLNPGLCHDRNYSQSPSDSDRRRRAGYTGRVPSGPLSGGVK